MTCKYEELEERVDMMVDAPNYYLFSVGDTHDNYLPKKYGDGMFHQLIAPEIQKQLVEKLYMRLKPRWLGAVQGCHEEWSYESDQFNWTAYLSKKLGCPNFGHGGLARLQLGETMYKIMLRHRYRFNSSFNLTHTVKRMREQLGEFDVGCVAHHHQASIEQVSCGDGIERIFLRPGSFKAPDRYAKRMGWMYDTGSHIPTVIFYPERRRMIPFLHLEDAIDFMNSVLAS
jgi:hypothetical protein